MEFSKPRIWRPGDDIWDLCAPQALHDHLPPFRSIFTGELWDPRQRDLVMQSLAPNTVLRSALIAIVGGAHPRSDYRYIGVGTGGNPTDPDNDTALHEPISTSAGGVANGQIGALGAYTSAAVSVGPNGWSYTAYWPSAAGNGDLAEVGITGGFGYLNRARFLDVDGITPIIIPKDSSHVMRITVQVLFDLQRRNL